MWILSNRAGAALVTVLLVAPSLAVARPVPAGVRAMSVARPSAASSPDVAVLGATVPVRLRAGRSPSAGAPAARFRWPLAGTPRVVRRFDPPPQPWLPGHRGVDLAATPGVEVRSAGAGVVLFAGTVAGRPVVTVGHADGLRTTYEPVRPGPAAGARVAAGTPIGLLIAGHPGCGAPACLHWGLRRGDEYLDPLALLGLGPVRLLPLDPPPAGPAAQPPPPLDPAPA
ncbi:M23 family metallopeptidase [Micromonospora sp. A3M-1-15]|uniref:murein hydrolase activator EnvC family protein n=1 Tax=Micromonospora sp. A3M-1-15 TaxID=2962035 RepID=UPI0020B8AE2A|nr:peptidoglycan DD-metalloendopeptidase family protein [Micromonospora sp. A3M-1-15]MCP3782623.1 M23 family metallopeptidase [Micromonospora sp. A3M-1-15]